jgi:hypothetical protein
LALTNALLKLNTVSKDKFVVYPNPAADSVSISFPSEFDKATIFIYNAIGQLMVSKELSGENRSVALDAFSSGMYWYQIESNKTFQSGKISKQ